MIEMFFDYHSPSIRFVRHKDQWYILTATWNGWESRREWHPSAAVEKSIASKANRVSLYNRALTREMYGIPQDVLEGV